MPFTTNLVLQSLPDAERRALEAKLERIEIKQHEVLFEVREVVSDVYFPFDAVVSLVVPLSTGEVIETAMVGRDGLIGAGAALNGRVSLNRAIVQLGGQCQRLPVGAFREIITGHPRIQALIGSHEQALFAQAQQSAACNATHELESRLARWLLRAFDLHGGDELDLTQEYIAEMLGVRRTSVSVVANTLQQAGMIDYARGHIRLKNVVALKETACECYETVKMNYSALLHSTNE